MTLITDKDYLAKARMGRKTSAELAVAYHLAKGLSELMATIMHTRDSLPVSEQQAVGDAAQAALEAYGILDSLIIDSGNQPIAKQPTTTQGD
jgi:hypothetical protein